MLDRRSFLKSSSLLALAPTVPAFLAQTARAAAPDREGRVLVVVQLDGGNDGLNTVVPFGDEAYARYRPRLRLPVDQLIKLNDGVGLHPSLRAAAKLLEQKQLAVVQGVGYPNPNRSHARSMAVWQTARFDPEEHRGSGWIGRALDASPTALPVPASLFIGTNAPPAALRGRRSVASALAHLEDYRVSGMAGPVKAMPAPADDLAAFIRRSLLDAYTTADRLSAVARGGASAEGYPQTPLAGQLRLVARLIKASFAARVYYTVQSGYDTHAQQLPVHANLLSEWGGAVQAFLDDLAAARLADRVAVLAFSEFGRQVRENASGGTDHGTAGVAFLAGPGVHSGLAGTPPSLVDLVDGEPKMTVDFRQVYATILENWLGLPAKEALGGAFERLPLFT